MCAAVGLGPTGGAVQAGAAGGAGRGAEHHHCLPLAASVRSCCYPTIHAAPDNTHLKVNIGHRMLDIKDSEKAKA